MIAKLAVTIIGLIALALGVTVLLDYAKFERAFTEVAESRFVFVVKELRSTIETGLGLGLSLASLKNMEPVIEREARNDEHIVSIALFDREHILIQAGKARAARAPGELETLWQRALTTPAADHWRGATPTAWQIGVSLTDNAGQRAGGLVLEYDRALYERDLAQMLADLARGAAMCGLGVAPLVLLALFGLFHRTRHSLTRIRRALAELRSDSSATAFQPRADAPLEQHYAAAERKTQEALALLVADSAAANRAIAATRISA